MMTEDQERELLSFRSNPDSDNIKIKEVIKRVLINDARIIHLLNNPDLDEDCPDDYLYVNILPYIRIPDTQFQVKHFICFSTDFTDVSNRNQLMKYQYIKFIIFCWCSDIKTEYGIARHDLLGHLIQQDLNWTNLFGVQAKLISDKENISDTGYTCRTMQFELRTPNGITRTLDSITKFIVNTPKETELNLN